MITLTKNAIDKLLEISEDEDLGTTVRVCLKGGGCSGYLTDLYFENNIRDTDEQFDFDGIKIIIDPISLQYLAGTEIDYINNLMQSGFKFNNPNISSSCGCGKSVSF
jgi:iron-sulfur cluster assembly accessory protein